MNYNNIKSKDSEYPSDNLNINVTNQRETTQKESTKSNRSCNTDLCFQSTENELSNLDGLIRSRSCAEQNPCDVGRITVDAVHPLFIGYRNISRDVATSTDNQKYYCHQCEVYLDLLKEAVIEHFKNTVHQSTDTCIYCNSSVYEYFYNDKRIIYHKCNLSEVLECSANGTEIRDISNSDVAT